MFYKLLITFLTLVAVVMGLHYFKREFNVGPGLNFISQYLPKNATPTPELLSPVPDLSATSAAIVLTPRAQLSRLLAVPVILDEDSIASSSISLTLIGELEPAVVTLFGSDIAATTAAVVIDQLQALPNPPIIAVDHEGGTVQRLSGDGFTILPSWRTLCQMAPEKREQLLASAAAELKAVGVDLVLGPVVDRTASGSALAGRTCSSQPEVIAQNAQALIDIFEKNGIASMLKHYPGIGAARADLHTRSAVIALTPQDTQPFETLLTQTPSLPVMIGHVRIEPAQPDLPCSMSTLCVGELRRVYPQSLLVTDALEMKSAGFLASSSALLRPLPERAASALQAGVDMLLFGPSVTELELTESLDLLEQVYVVQGKLDARVTTHFDRVTQWQQSLRAQQSAP
jgi:beta-N-acetylhexosaminidase